MTITIRLTGPELDKLREEAGGLGLSVEQLAQAIVERHTLRSRTGVPSDAVDEETFRAAKADTFRENDELYRRLAQ